MEMPENYDKILNEEVKRIIEKYPKRLRSASSVVAETQEILKEEGKNDPRFMNSIPLKVLATIKSIENFQKPKTAKNDLMARYAEESRRSAGNRYDIEEKRKEY